MRKHAIVTGATGFLGRHLVAQLAEQGWHVIALCRDHFKTAHLPEGVKVVLGDITDAASLDKIPAGADVVFHTAASTNTWKARNHEQTRINVDGTGHVLEMAIRKGVPRFVHTSSVVVWGTHVHAVHEDLPKAGEDSWINYVRTKTLAENMVLAENVRQRLEVVVLNPTHIIGPGDTRNWARLIQLLAKRKLPAVPPGAGSFADVRSVAAAHIAAYEKGRPGENYLLGGDNLSFARFIALAAEKLAVKPPRLALSEKNLMRLARLKDGLSRLTRKEPDITPESVALISHRYRNVSDKAQKHLGYTSLPVSESLDDCIAHLRLLEYI